MELVKLLVVFGVMLVLLLGFKRPIWMAALVANILALFVYAIPPMESLGIIKESFSSTAMIEMLLVLYLVSLLQELMENKGAIGAAEEAMLRLFNNRRVNIMISPVLMGMLPAPNAVLLASPIVDAAGGDAINPVEKAYVTSYLRHVPESSFPLYPAILLAVGVAQTAKIPNTSAAHFLLGMVPMMLLSFIVPYWLTIRKVPKETGLPHSDNKARDFKQLVVSLSPILILIFAVIVLGLFVEIKTSIATAVVVFALFFIYRVKPGNVWPTIKKAFKPATIAAMAFLYLFKDVMKAAGIIDSLPETFAKMPLPLIAIYGLLMFIGAMLGLSQAFVPVVLTLAFASIPGAGLPVMLLIMCCNHAAMQLTPTHICLDIVSRYFKVNFVDLMIKTIPVTVVYMGFAVAYYFLLNLIM